MTTKSPLIWFGGKSKFAKHIISKMPDHKIYIEPFGGAAHVIAQKPRTRHEVYNDIDGNVVNFILQSIENTDRLIERCLSIPYSREIYDKWRREPLPEEPFERAVRFFYLNRSAIPSGNAEETPKTGWRNSTKSNQNVAMGYANAAKRIKEFSERMQGVMIERADFRKIITKYDADDALFYVDPPYIGREKHYAGGFTEKDHRELAELLNKLKGKAIVSYYEHPLLKDLYSNWNRDYFKVFTQRVGIGTNKEAEELLLTNYRDKSTT